MNRILRTIVIFPIRLYQWVLSPILTYVFGMRCRYDPSCSHYMAQSISEWGIFRGTWMGLKRIGRCHPWGGYGPDPVPPNPKNKNKNVKKTQEK